MFTTLVMTKNETIRKDYEQLAVRIAKASMGSAAFEQELETLSIEELRGGELFSILWDAYDRDVDYIGIVYSLWRMYRDCIKSISDGKSWYFSTDAARHDFLLFLRTEYGILADEFVQYFVSYNVDRVRFKVMELERLS